MKSIKNRYKVIIAMVLIAITFASIDISRATRGEKPVFTFSIYDRGENKVHLGFLYYINEKVSISPTQPFYASDDVKVGVWFIPGITVFKGSEGSN